VLCLTRSPARWRVLMHAIESTPRLSVGTLPYVRNVTDTDRRRKSRDGAARLLLVDDHELARAGLRSLLDHERDLEIVGEAGSGAEALALYRDLQPDLLVLDLHMPDPDGLAVTQIVKTESPATRVVIVTLDVAPGRLIAALQAGADAYVLKGSTKRDLVQVIRGALAGELLLQSELANRLVETLQTSPAGWLATGSEPITPLERDILKLCAERQSRVQIGEALSMSQIALSAHIQQLLGKLRISNS
jgi:DNA-binding NarL/FixJ family response regulator